MRSLHLGTRSVVVYVSEFNHIKADLHWNENALISHFRHVLRDEIKDYLCLVFDPSCLSELISQTARFDNRLSQKKIRATFFGLSFNKCYCFLQWYLTPY
jgi:hypothetical protein